MNNANVILSRKNCVNPGIIKQKKEDKQMSVIEINSQNFKEEVLNSDKTVLIDFWAAWCGPCRMVGPIIDEAALRTLCDK